MRANDTIYHEDLQVRNMVKNHHLAKSIPDAGWAAFLSILTYKAACAGREVIAVILRHQPDLFWLRCSGRQELIRPLAFVSGMRNEPASRSQRREEYRTGRAGPSGRRGVGCVAEPSIPLGSVNRTSFARRSHSDKWFPTRESVSSAGSCIRQKGLYRHARRTVIDDSPTVRLTLRKWLEGAGYAVEEAADGMEGFNKLRASKEPLIVLLDYQMPKLSGFEVLQLALAEGNLLKKHGYIVIRPAEHFPAGLQRVAVAALNSIAAQAI